jgi:16S rRNA (adenine1518-N6/adenine1519-N6)-dimethyltransferase
VVRLTPRPFPVICQNESFLATLVQKAFQQRRKMLGNALKGVVSPENFEKAEISPLQRAETLSVAQFVALTNSGILPVLN